MFNLKQFIEDCQGKSAAEVKDLVTEGLRDPAALRKALDEALADRDIAKGGIAASICFRSPNLTVLRAMTPPHYKTPPHNHNMWAVIGTCDGQEDNFFYRRGTQSLEKAGEKQLKQGDVVVLGAEVIHAIANPLERASYAIHVYGGDLLNFANRSVWNPFTFDEHPYEMKLVSDYARELMNAARN
ncbi:MAG TPA: hypothetical protein VMT61_16595 [Candidatus Binataceae bacterium]|nr:hypothetical protein [Candidatus Binataceae bacterium]